MANNEYYSPDTPSGLPIVSPDILKTYKDQPHSVEEILERLKRDGNAALAYDLITGVNGIDPHFLQLKYAFAQGALFMYEVLQTAAQVNKLEEQLSLNINDGGDVEDPPPLT